MINKYSKLFAITLGTFFVTATGVSAKEFTLDDFLKELDNSVPEGSRYSTVYVGGQHAFTDAHILDSSDILAAGNSGAAVVWRITKDFDTDEWLIDSISPLVKIADEPKPTTDTVFDIVFVDRVEKYGLAYNVSQALNDFETNYLAGLTEEYKNDEDVAKAIKDAKAKFNSETIKSEAELATATDEAKDLVADALETLLKEKLSKYADEAIVDDQVIPQTAYNNALEDIEAHESLQAMVEAYNDAIAALEPVSEDALTAEREKAKEKLQAFLDHLTGEENTFDGYDYLTEYLETVNSEELVSAFVEDIADIKSVTEINTREASVESVIIEAIRGIVLDQLRPYENEKTVDEHVLLADGYNATLEAVNSAETVDEIVEAFETATGTGAEENEYLVTEEEYNTEKAREAAIEAADNYLGGASNYNTEEGAHTNAKAYQKAYDKFLKAVNEATSVPAVKAALDQFKTDLAKVKDNLATAKLNAKNYINTHFPKANYKTNKEKYTEIKKALEDEIDKCGSIEEVNALVETIDGRFAEVLNDKDQAIKDLDDAYDALVNPVADEEGNTTTYDLNKEKINGIYEEYTGRLNAEDLDIATAAATYKEAKEKLAAIDSDQELEQAQEPVISAAEKALEKIKKDVKPVSGKANFVDEFFAKEELMNAITEKIKAIDSVDELGKHNTEATVKDIVRPVLFDQLKEAIKGLLNNLYANGEVNADGKVLSENAYNTAKAAIEAANVSRINGLVEAYNTAYGTLQDFEAMKSEVKGNLTEQGEIKISGISTVKEIESLKETFTNLETTISDIETLTDLETTTKKLDDTIFTTVKTMLLKSLDELKEKFNGDNFLTNNDYQIAKEAIEKATGDTRLRDIVDAYNLAVLESSNGESSKLAKDLIKAGAKGVTVEENTVTVEELNLNGVSLEVKNGLDLVIDGDLTIGEGQTITISNGTLHLTSNVDLSSIDSDDIKGNTQENFFINVKDGSSLFSALAKFGGVTVTLDNDVEVDKPLVIG